MRRVPLSILDLATVHEGQAVGEALAGSVALAQRAETLGYTRVWYAEHHNMAAVASSATAVLIAHIATQTSTIRLGAGGIMLPNHSPLVIAEQFGTLAALHPDRIDLGLGRAPGTDQTTVRALRRDPAAADRFPSDVLELQAFLSDESRVEGVHATPGRGTHVPLYILGSSLFGAQLAAALGLPYAFASHFAPQALHAAIAEYRSRFRPSEQLAEPHVIAGINVLADTTDADAHAQFERVRRLRTRLFFGRTGRAITEDEAEAILASPQGIHIDQMLTYSAVGSPATVDAWIDDFLATTDADELIVAHQAPGVEERLRSADLLASVRDPSG